MPRPTPLPLAAPSFQSTNTIATYARRMAQFKRPDINIFLNDHHDEKVYTTFDAISGRVELTAPYSARFDDVQISLEGATKTYVENMSPASANRRTSAYHNFLRLVMPIRDLDYPQPRIAEPGRTYTFPFNFAIPNQLLPHACSHRCTEDHVHQAHIQLPPSIGDRDVSIKDDLAPEMAKISYVIRVKVTRIRERDGKTVVLAEGLKKLHIVPAISEEPPMSISVEDKEYSLSKTKSLKKGMFSGKLGRITVSTSQTGAFVLPAPSSSSDVPATKAIVNIRFDPHDSTSQPPRLGGLTAKIRALTFYAVKPAMNLASESTMVADFADTRGLYSTTVSLSSRCMENVSWEKHQEKQQPKPAYTRRGSESTCTSDCSDNSVDEGKEKKEYYTATLVVPLTLPSSKSWVPSFHGCIVSRTYALEFVLSIHTPGTGVPASSVSLCLPVQIAALGNQDGPIALTASEAAAELIQAEQYFRPRVIEIPSDELVMNSVLILPASAPGPRSDLPPMYENFGEVGSNRTVSVLRS